VRTRVAPLIDGKLLEKEAGVFLSEVKAASIVWVGFYEKLSKAEKKVSAPPTTLLWKALEGNLALAPRILTFLKLANLAFVLVGGSVQDERAFSDLKYIKDPKRNGLVGENLDACMRVYCHRAKNVDTFPFARALKRWNEVVTRRGSTLIHDGLKRVRKGRVQKK
jgi:hypothetical protein